MTSRFHSGSFGVLLTVACLQAGADDILIVAQAGSPIKSLTLEQARSIFTLQTNRVMNVDVRPVDLPEDSPVRQQAMKKLGIDVRFLVSLRARQIFSGNGFPPVKAKSETEAGFLVGNNSALVGYLSSESAGTGLTVLLRLPAN